jgi:hypothetical protein
MATFIFCLVLSGCSASDESPSVIVQKFYEALMEKNVERMEAYSTPRTVELLTKTLFGKTYPWALRRYGKFNIFEEKIDGDSAMVRLKFENGNTENWPLIKVDNKWMVDFEK